MLFYERRNKTPIKVVVPEAEEKRLSPDNCLNELLPNLKDLPVSKDEDKKESFVNANFNAFDIFVAHGDYDKVHKDN
jgi:hypothetical protein